MHRCSARHFAIIFNRWGWQVYDRYFFGWSSCVIVADLQSFWRIFCINLIGDWGQWRAMFDSKVGAKSMKNIETNTRSKPKGSQLELS